MNENKEYVGLLLESQAGGRVVLDRPDAELGPEILIAKKDLGGAPFGMKVVCRLRLRQRLGPPLGFVVEVLGDPGRPDVAIQGILRQYGLQEAFPAAVAEEVQGLARDLDDQEIERALAQGYRDRRQLPTITIDGEDAKDLDDAIDIEKAAGGALRLYVHIADLDHYVRPGTALDKEAERRGNSVYLVDRVLPMLPAALSNGLGSLNPGRVRRALTCEMEIDPQGTVRAYEIYPSLISSKARCSYEEVRQILEGQEKPAADRPAGLTERLQEMQRLAEWLWRKRQARGSLAFNFPETRVDLDDQGHPLRIYPEKLSFANQLIEEFMIVANETVARHLVRHKLPGIYRVHEDPDPVKLRRFTRLAATFGLRVRLSRPVRPADLADLLERLQGRPYEAALSRLLLQSLAKADYRAENGGHFGLAASDYCHFTAPIRRYADLYVHRQLKAAWRGQPGDRRRERERAARIAEGVSETERRALEAERASVDQKACEYYAKRLGEVEEGVVDGFSGAALFVRLKNTVSGAVLFHSLDGYYVFDPERLRAVNQRTRQEIRIGDPVRVQVAAVDLSRRRLDFQLVWHRTARAFVRAQSKNSGRAEKKRPGRAPRKRPQRRGPRRR